MNELILDKKRIIRGIIISLVIGITAFLVITFVTIEQNTWTSLSYIDKKYLFFAFILIVFAAGIDALRIKMTVEAVNEKITFPEALKVYYISNFAGGITPFFSGTLPTQIYLFDKNIKNKMTLGKATMVATIMPLIKTLVFAIFTPIIFFTFKKTITNYTILSSILINGAILISLFFLFLFILAAKYPEKMIGIIFKIQHLPCILKFSKKETIKHFFDRVTMEIKEYHKSFSLLKENWIKLLLSTLYTIIFWCTFFLTAPLLLRGFNLNFNLSHVLVMQIIFYFILPFMPTPGGSGTAEVGFASLFSFFVPLHLLGLFVGAWRFIAFYFNLCIGAIVLLVEIKRLKKIKKKKQQRRREEALDIK
ncbi:MAG: lysylphosphatidylglycerol synthase transmembrane domain-containing protein [Candidatus Caldatribacteriota bacterium]|nr:lysylphosphatidylglycerol synthase transmembrane domain-containing protein [Candidatus Caldatribacteriota bacterium]